MFVNVDSEVSEGTCPFCGSSESFQYKTEKGLMFVCHDCQRNVPASFLPESKQEKIESQVNFTSLLGLCTKLTELPSDHFCVKYVKDRKIPQKTFDFLYYTENFETIAETVGKKLKSGPRLILPFINKDGKMFAMQGRALDDDKVRYITLVFDKEEELVFGSDRVDMTKPFFVVEGPLDSLFLDNAVATAGLNNLSDKYVPLATICHDNEPRNQAVVKSLKKNIERGFKVVIWSSNNNYKDINEMVLGGINIEEEIQSNIFHGLVATMKLNNWKKV